MRHDIPLHLRGPKPVHDAVHPLFGSGYGFVPDVISTVQFAELPEASATILEQHDSGAGRFNIPSIQPPYGREGMMPPPSLGRKR